MILEDETDLWTCYSWVKSQARRFQARLYFFFFSIFAQNRSQLPRWGNGGSSLLENEVWASPWFPPLKGQNPLLWASSMPSQARTRARASTQSSLCLRWLLKICAYVKKKQPYSLLYSLDFGAKIKIYTFEVTYARVLTQPWRAWVQWFLQKWRTLQPRPFLCLVKAVVVSMRTQGKTQVTWNLHSQMKGSTGLQAHKWSLPDCGYFICLEGNGSSHNTTPCFYEQL